MILLIGFLVSLAVPLSVIAAFVILERNGHERATKRGTERRRDITPGTRVRVLPATEGARSLMPAQARLEPILLRRHAVGGGRGGVSRL